MNFFEEFFTNQILGTSVIAWAVAQVLKIVIELIKYKKSSIVRLVGSGGMPSSHSSTVTSLATAVGLHLGFDSASFAMSFIFAFIVMYDAAGVRRAVGEQARILNEMIEDASKGKAVDMQVKLKELIGHTKKEVLVGAMLGIAIAVALYYAWN